MLKRVDGSRCEFWAVMKFKPCSQGTSMKQWDVWMKKCKVGKQDWMQSAVRNKRQARRDNSESRTFVRRLWVIYGDLQIPRFERPQDPDCAASTASWQKGGLFQEMQGRLGTATLLYCLWSKLCVAQADHRTPRSGVSKAGNYQRRIHLVILGMTQWWLTCCFPTRTTRTSSELAALRGKGAFPRPGWCSANWTSGGSTGAMSCSNPMDRTGERFRLCLLISFVCRNGMEWLSNVFNFAHGLHGLWTGTRVETATMEAWNDSCFVRPPRVPAPLQWQTCHKRPGRLR